MQHCWNLNVMKLLFIGLISDLIFAEPCQIMAENWFNLDSGWLLLVKWSFMKHRLKRFMRTTRIFIVCYDDTLIQLPLCIWRARIFATSFNQWVMDARHFNKSKVKCGPPRIWSYLKWTHTVLLVSQQFSLTSICFLASWLLNAPKFKQKDPACHLIFHDQLFKSTKSRTHKSMAW